MSDFQAAQFRRAKGADSRLVIKPHLDAYLMSGQWPDDFSIRFRKHVLEHGPDGWFHPSTHPLMGLKRLWYYLAAPEQWVPEVKEPKSILTTTIGEALHGFAKTLLIDAGLLDPPPGNCPCGDPECDEWWTIDEVARSRGHADGRTSLYIEGYPDGPKNFEFKSATPLKKLGDDLDLDWLIGRHPDYWAQQQEYMRMLGLPMTVLVFMMTGYPYDTREFHIPADPNFQNETVEKYMLALECADQMYEPTVVCPSCYPGGPITKECEARTLCPVALAV